MCVCVCVYYIYNDNGWTALVVYHRRDDDQVFLKGATALLRQVLLHAHAHTQRAYIHSTSTRSVSQLDVGRKKKKKKKIGIKKKYAPPHFVVAKKK